MATETKLHIYSISVMPSFRRPYIVFVVAPGQSERAPNCIPNSSQACSSKSSSLCNISKWARSEMRKNKFRWKNNVIYSVEERNVWHIWNPDPEFGFALNCIHIADNNLFEFILIRFCSPQYLTQIKMVACVGTGTERIHSINGQWCSVSNSNCPSAISHSLRCGFLLNAMNACIR